MVTRGEKGIVTFLCTLAVTWMVVVEVLPVFAKWPIQGGLVTLFLTPLAHIGIHLQCREWILLSLAFFPIPMLGIYLGNAWLQEKLAGAMMRAGRMYVMIVAACLLMDSIKS